MRARDMIDAIGVPPDRWPAISLLALLIAHFVWLCGFVAPGYASPDADGYFAQARLIATQGRTTIAPASPVQYFGIHWLEQANGQFISRYPFGLPLLLAGIWSLLGREPTFYLNPLLATLTLLFLFLFCRARVGERLALAAAAAYAVVPLANRHAVHSDAHTAAAFFLMAGIWALDGWSRRGGIGLAIAAGLLLGYLPTVRYAEAAAGIGVLLFLALHWTLGSSRRKEMLWMIAAAALPLGLLLLYNQVHFGAFWRTGYALTNEQQITLNHFSNNWRSYLDALMGSGIGAFAALGIGGMAAMSLRRDLRPLVLLLFVTALSISVVYAGYYFNRGPQGASIRFLLPTLPLYLLPAMWLVRQFADRRVAAAALGILLAVQWARGIPGSMERLRREHDGAKRSALAVDWLERNIPESSVIISSRRLLEQVNHTGKWKLADAAVVLGDRPGFGPGARFGTDPERPSPRQSGKGARLRAKYEGLGPGQRAYRAIEDARGWAEGKETYWIAGGEREIRQLEDLMPDSGMLERVGTMELPAPRASSRPGFGPGGMDRQRMRQRMRRFMGGGFGGGRAGPFPGGGGMFSVSGTWEVYRITL